MITSSLENITGLIHPTVSSKLTRAVLYKHSSTNIGIDLYRSLFPITRRREGVEYLNYGEAASTLPPPLVNATGEVWDPSEEQCDQEPFSDFTGVDLLAAPFVSLILFVSVQWWEHVKERPLFEFPGSEGYEKSHETEKDKVQDWASVFEVIFSVIVSSANGIVFLIFTVAIVLVKASL
jgi:hypothetical protein